MRVYSGNGAVTTVVTSMLRCYKNQKSPNHRPPNNHARARAARENQENQKQKTRDQTRKIIVSTARPTENESLAASLLFKVVRLSVKGMIHLPRTRSVAFAVEPRPSSQFQPPGFSLSRPRLSLLPPESAAFDTSGASASRLRPFPSRTCLRLRLSLRRFRLPPSAFSPAHLPPAFDFLPFASAASPLLPLVSAFPPHGFPSHPTGIPLPPAPRIPITLGIPISKGIPMPWNPHLPRRPSAPIIARREQTCRRLDGQHHLLSSRSRFSRISRISRISSRNLSRGRVRMSSKLSRSLSGLRKRRSKDRSSAS
jgi:hypothetical protein